MKEIQDEQASKARMRNMNRLRKFLEGMEQYIEVFLEQLIEVFLNASEFVAFFLLQVTRNHVRAFDALLEHYEDMGEQLEPIQHHQPLFELRENGHLNAVLEMIFGDILDFHAKALSYFQQKRWRIIFDATWNNFRTRFSEPMNNLRRHRKLLENYANLTALERISALSNDQTEALKLQRRHLNLATICLSYLTVGHVDVSLSDEIVEANIINGCYAFFDYAASHWLDHLTISVTKLATLDASSVERLGREIRHFLGQHFQKVAPKSIPLSFAKGFDVRSSFGPEDFLGELSQATYTKRKEEPNVKDDQKLGPKPRLETFIPRLRSSLDKVAQRLKDSTGLLQLQNYHGSGLFKCQFVHCDYFHTGFPDKSARDSHQTKHDRAFFCVFDGCSYGITGFADSKSLAAHTDNVHT
ncbi:hypothetical protein B0T26DRAFT_830132, partial [Lasiosphaeria miniovina]